MNPAREVFLMYKQREVFWEKRAKCYEKLEWATKSGYLRAFLEGGKFQKNDIVLDIGTGTGIVAHTISPYVKRVIGIDISKDMLAQALKHKVFKEEFLIMDAREMGYPSESFTAVTARMVFHHILDGTQKAMDECFRVLKKKGRLIFSEGVPPSEHVVPFYKEIFKLKEERITFTEESMEFLVRNSGFNYIEKIIYWIRGASIRNWLSNSGLSINVQEKIFQMHIDLDEQGKKDYNMTIYNNDCYIDMKFVIIVAVK